MIDTPVYYTIDSSATTQAVQNAMMQADASRAALVTQGVLNIQGFNSTSLSGLQTELQSSVQTYMNNIDTMKAENDIYNTNMFMNQSMTLQEQQINELSEKARNHIMRLRQKYQLKLYDISYFGFITTVLLYAMFIVAISGAMLAAAYKVEPGAMDPTTAWIVIGVVTGIYLVIVFIYARNNSNRRKTDWSKYYFGTYGSSQNQTCAS